jgi:hypothetical protein
VAALAGAAGLAVSALAEMTSAAAADRDEAAQLAGVIANATGSTADYTAAVNEAIAAGQALAFTDSQTRAALEPLVRATGDLGTATGQLAIVQDIARAAEVDLAVAAEAVAKANLGQDKALRSLLPGLAAGSTATETLANAQKLAAGSAERFGKSQAGTAAKTADAMGELGETIGSALLPLLDALMPALLPIIQAFGDLITELLPVLIPLIKILGAVFGIVAKIIVGVVRGIVDFIKAIADAIRKIGEFLRKIPLLGDLLGGSVPSVSGAGGGGGGGGGGGIQINIQGDPVTVQRAVLTALRDYGARTGIAVI